MTYISSQYKYSIFEEKPDVVVCLGDWFDMASLSSHDKGKKSFEGRRYKQDVAVGDKVVGKAGGLVKSGGASTDLRFVVTEASTIPEGFVGVIKL